MMDDDDDDDDDVIYQVKSRDLQKMVIYLFLRFFLLPFLGLMTSSNRIVFFSCGSTASCKTGTKQQPPGGTQ